MASREEKEKELERLLKEEELESLLADEQREEADVGLGEQIKRSARGFNQTLEDWSPFAGLARKAGYAGYAAIEKTFGDSDKSFDEIYEGEKQRDNAEMERVRRETPDVVRNFGNTVGGMGAFGVGRNVLAGATGVLPALGRIGIVGTTGALERGTSNPDELWDSEEAAAGALLSGGFSTAAEGVTGIANSLPRIRQFARDRAVKAVTGQNLAVQRKMRGTGAATEDMSAHDYAGDFLLGRTEGKQGKPVLGVLGNPENTLPKLQAIASEEAPELGYLATEIDAAFPDGVVDARDIAKAMDRYADSLPVTGQTMPVISRIRAEAALYRAAGREGKIPKVREGGPSIDLDKRLAGQKPETSTPRKDVSQPGVRTGSTPPAETDTFLTGGRRADDAPRFLDIRPSAPNVDVDALLSGKRLDDIRNARYLEPPSGSAADIDALLAGRDPNARRLTFGDLRHQKGGYKFDPMDTSTHTFGKAGSNELYSIIRKTENEAADRVAANASIDPALSAKAAQFRRMKADAQVAANLIPAAEKRIAGNQSNRFVSLTDYMAMLTAAGRASQGDVTAALRDGVIAGFVNNQLRSRGSAIAARSANALGNTIEGMSGPYSKSIRNALRNGTGAFTAAQVQERLSEAERDWMARQLEPTHPGL